MAQRFPTGSLVVTPTGRVAKVTGHDSDGRVCLRYQDCAPHLAVVDLPAKLLKPANKDTAWEM